MKLIKVKVKDLVVNPDNPRFINEFEYELLKKSLEDFPEMKEVRPIVVDEDNVILGGNQRANVLKRQGVEEVEVFKVFWNEDKKKEFVLKDNMSYGHWDWDIVANQFDKAPDFGLNPPDFQSDYTPEFNPTIDKDEVTNEEIENRARELAEQMKREFADAMNCVCPECGHEFEVY